MIVTVLTISLRGRNSTKSSHAVVSNIAPSYKRVKSGNRIRQMSYVQSYGDNCWAYGDQDISARIQMFGTPQLARVLLLNIFGYVS